MKNKAAQNVLLAVSGAVIAAFVVLAVMNNTLLVAFLPTLVVLSCLDAVAFLAVFFVGKRPSMCRLHGAVGGTFALLMLICAFMASSESGNSETLRVISGVLFWSVIPSILFTLAIDYAVWWLETNHRPTENDNEEGEKQNGT